VWPTDQFPLRQVGRLVLDTNIENFHNENEQIAFSPGRVVPGDPCCSIASAFLQIFLSSRQRHLSSWDQADRLWWWYEVVCINYV
jgi:Catalase